jgi:hypothetical protein
MYLRELGGSRQRTTPEPLESGSTQQVVQAVRHSPRSFRVDSQPIWVAGKPFAHRGFGRVIWSEKFDPQAGRHTDVVAGHCPIVRTARSDSPRRQVLTSWVQWPGPRSSLAHVLTAITPCEPGTAGPAALVRLLWRSPARVHDEAVGRRSAITTSPS